MILKIRYFTFLFMVATLVGCNNRMTLQRYFVDNQESSDFISLDLPSTVFNLEEKKLTDDQKEAYNSVKRLNFLGYKANSDDIGAYNRELAKVSAILKNKEFNDLIEFSDRGKKVVVKYIGNDDEADEVVLFGSSKELGFGIIRILGNNMRPENMAELVGSIKKSKINTSQFERIADFFK